MNHCINCKCRLLRNTDDDLCDACYAVLADAKADAVCDFCNEPAQEEVNDCFVCSDRQCYNEALMKQEV